MFAALVIVSAALQKAPNPLAPGIYVDHALSVMRSEAVAAPDVNWVAVTRHVHRMAAAAKTPEDTYPAIQYALDQLRRAGDGHAAFVYPGTAGPVGIPRFQPLPTVALVLRRIGEVTLPPFQRSFNSAWGRRYTTTVLSGTASLERQAHPCGWIVDLDGDFGGNGWAMVLSVGPIIGEGRVVGLTGRKGLLGWVSYRDHAVSGLGYSFRAPVEVAPITPAPPVAVLTSQETTSGGEFVTVAFRGRPQTRSFGAATAGATNGPHAFRLADGAELFFGVNYFVDRLGVVYKHPIPPDVTVYLDQAAASRWLLSTPACTRASRSDY